MKRMTFKHISLQINQKRLYVLLIILIYGAPLIAQTATWQIKPTYDSVKIISDKMIKVEKNGRSGICSYDGTRVVECKYDIITPFKDNYALLIEDGVVKGNANITGKVVMFDNNYQIDLNYPYYSEGLLAVKHNGKWGYIDTDGNIVIDCKFRNALPFMKGFASVSDGEGHFMHITKSGKISLLGMGFNDDDLKFATSFITDDKGNVVSVIVTSKWKAYKRDANGRKDGAFELDNVVVDTKARKITSDKIVLYFDNAWRLSAYEVKGIRQKEYYHQENFNKDYTPTQYGLMPYTNTDGVSGLKMNDKIVIPEQFDNVVILDGSLALASQNGLYGILSLNLDETINAGIENPEINLNHHIGSRISGNIFLPESLKNKYCEITSIKSESGLDIVPEQTESSFSFNYLPDDIVSGHSQEFEINVKVDGIKYLPVTKRVDFNHQFSFNVTTPDKVSLNENNQGKFNVYITNESAHKSDICEIYVDDRLVKTHESFSSGQRISVSVNKTINMEDEDMKTKSINIRIVEKGCPEYVVNKRITFERYYANN